MTRIKTPEQIQGIRNSCRMLSSLFEALEPMMVPGVLPLDLDRFAEKYIKERGGRPAFLGYEGYPATLCISANHTVIHGIPDNRRLQEGDIVGIDCGIELNGYYSDAAVTYPIGTISSDLEKLCKVTINCLNRAIDAARSGKRIHDISRAVYGLAISEGYGVVRQYCGHGVGLEIHEDPQIPNYLSSGPNPRIIPGMVLAIEPMINIGTGEVRLLDDDWTVVTMDGKASAHYEHTIVILPDSVEVLTAWADPFRNYKSGI